MIPKPIEAEVEFDDERHDLQYTLRVRFTEERDEGSPGTGVRIERLRVVEVRRLGEDGRVVSVDTGPEVRRFEPRVWELLEDDPLLREQVEEDCLRHPLLEPSPSHSTGWMRRANRRGPAEQRGAG